MSSWANPALQAMKMSAGFTLKDWNPLDAKNTCNVCPCLWSSPEYYYYRHDQPCGIPLIAIGARSNYLLIVSRGYYYELSGYFWPEYIGAPTPPQPTSPPLAAATLQAIFQVTPPGEGLIEFPFLEFPFTIDEFEGTKMGYGGPNTWDNQWVYQTAWTSKCYFDVSSWLTLAGPSNPYPNGTYDDIFSDSTGVYDRYYPCIDVPLPPEKSLLYLSGMFVDQNFGVTPGIDPKWFPTNSVSTDGSDAAAYARFSVPYVHTYGTNEPIGWGTSTSAYELRGQSQRVAGHAQGISSLKNIRDSLK